MLHRNYFQRSATVEHLLGIQRTTLMWDNYSLHACTLQSLKRCIKKHNSISTSLKWVWVIIDTSRIKGFSQCECFLFTQYSIQVFCTPSASTSIVTKRANYTRFKSFFIFYLYPPTRPCALLPRRAARISNTYWFFLRRM